MMETSANYLAPSNDLLLSSLVTHRTDVNLEISLLILHHFQHPFRMASNHGTLGHLLPPSYKRMIAEWLEEDCPSFDYGGFVVGEGEGEARLLGKSKVRDCVSFADFI